MSARHMLLELRTGRDAEHTPEAAAQMFASLPQLKNAWWLRLLGKDEALSFEIVVENQTISFNTVPDAWKPISKHPDCQLSR